jgi:uncharacterized membrane protein
LVRPARGLIALDIAGARATFHVLQFGENDMRFALLWAVVLAVFLAGDALMLPAVVVPFFEARVGDLMLEDPRMGAALAFYLLYPAGIVHFAAMPGFKAGAPMLAARQGALAGLLAYGTYEATNLATLKGWEWSMLALDMSWGAAISGTSAAIAVWAAMRVFGAPARGASAGV